MAILFVMKFILPIFNSSIDKRIKKIYEDTTISKDDIYYIKALYRSICNIQNKYVKSKTPFSGEKEEESIELEISYELYRQYQNILERGKNPLKLCVGPELRKHVSQSEIELYNAFDVQPDFVVHHNKEDYNCQLIAGEIKRQGSLTIDNTARDINKLLIYFDPELWGGHQYIYPVFAIFNTDKDVFTHVIKNFLKNEKKIEFIKTDASISIMTLKDYLNENISKIKKIVCFLYQQQDKVEFHTLYNMIKDEL